MRIMDSLQLLFGRAVIGGVLVPVIRIGMAMSTSREFNKLAKAIPGKNQPVTDEAADSWISIRVAQEGMSDYSHRLAEIVYQQEFVKLLQVKKDMFLKHGNGVAYINGVLQSLITISEDDDDFLKSLMNVIVRRQGASALSNALKGEHIGTTLGNILFDFAKDAFDKKVNDRNDKLASAYVLNMMEAYPLLDEMCLDNLKIRMRDVLEKAMVSDLVAPLLKDAMKRNFDRYSNKSDQSGESLPGLSLN